MTISDHAIKRYKQRIGCRTSSRKKVISRIVNDLKKDVVRRIVLSKEKGYYLLITSKYKAVCYKHKVISVQHLDSRQGKRGHLVA